VTHWHLKVAPLSIVYLAPAIRDKNSVATNLWRADPPNKPLQLTFAEYGVDDFAPSPDGTRIAFSQRDAAGKTDLYLLTLATQAIRPITHCVDAPCRAPAWNPDGTRLVYERADSTRPDSDTRAWLLDLSTLQTAPLLTDSRWLGKAPHWSPDGKTISLYDRNSGSLMLLDVASGVLSPIQTLEDNAGAFAPRGQSQIVYQELVMTASGAMRRLSVADYTTHTLHPLVSPDGTLTDDPVAVWKPDGVHLAVMRRYFDDRATNGAQVYEVDTTTGDAVPLVIDPNYAHGYLSWSPAGDQLLMQRYPLFEPDGKTGIWVYDAGSKRLTQVAQNGFFPQWLP
jgi:Tol biopolymer transport system component